MVEDVARRHAEVVLVGRRQGLEVAADFVDELEADLRVGAPAADGELVAAVGEAEPVGLLVAGAERAVRDDHAAWLAEVSERRRVADRVGRALPPVAARVV